MTHNRHVCAVLYEEEEYEALVLECYWQSKTNVKHSNNRYIYKCIYCSQQFLDKNGISYHRLMNLCKSWNGPGVLKMYPTWTRSNNSELKRIALKFGKDVKGLVKSTIPSQDERPRKRRRNVGNVDQHKKRKSIVVVDNVDFETHSVAIAPFVAIETDVNEVGCSEKDQVICELGSMKVYKSRNASLSVSKAKEKMSRIEVEECAKAEADSFTIENQFNFTSPPDFVPFHGLYVLMAETENEWISRDLLNMPDACIKHLRHLKDERLLGVTLSNAFGDWFTYENLEV